jgi:hypothetical protein
VRRLTFDPSTFITYMSEFPPRIVEKAMLRPSGAHAGHSSGSLEFVKRMAPDPSGFMLQMSN